MVIKKNDEYFTTAAANFKVLSLSNSCIALCILSGTPISIYLHAKLIHQLLYCSVAVVQNVPSCLFLGWHCELIWLLYLQQLFMV